MRSRRRSLLRIGRALGHARTATLAAWTCRFAAQLFSCPPAPCPPAPCAAAPFGPSSTQATVEELNCYFHPDIRVACVPWGHTRSFLSRIYVDTDAGQGFDWQVAQWPYLNNWVGGATITLMGQSGKIVWFTQVGDSNTYTAKYGVQLSLVFDPTNNVYVLSDQYGSTTTFDGTHLNMKSRSDAAGRAGKWDAARFTILKVHSITTTWPVVSTAQNGSGIADSRTVFFDAYARS
jgi:hypothetical protein